MPSKKTKTHVEECKELYFYDPYVTDLEYGAIMQDAYERDILEEMAREYTTPQNREAKEC